MSRISRILVGLTATLVLVVVVGCPVSAPNPGGDGSTPIGPPGAGTYTFCFWNVENLFDDQDDRRTTKGD